MPKKTNTPAREMDAPPVGNDAGGAEALMSYRVTSPLRHNGQHYKIGDLVELAADEFARLSAAGVVTDQPALS